MPLTTSGRPDECRTVHFKLQTDLARRARNVFGSGALLAVDHVEFNRFAIVQGLEAAPLDRGVVNEAILLAAFRRDEAEALVRIEPLDGSFHTHNETPPDDVLPAVGAPYGLAGDNNQRH